MPYKSDKQRRFMHAKHPEIASRWDKEHGGKVAGYGKSSGKAPKKGAGTKKPKPEMMKRVEALKARRGGKK